MKHIYHLVIVTLLSIQLNAQSVYVCTATSVNVRDSNCTSAISFGQVSMPHSFVVLMVTGMSCDYNWYMVDIPNVHNHPGYPLHAYVATHYFSESTSPGNYVTIINSPQGLPVKNTPGGTPVWIKNPGYDAAPASYENTQLVARTPADPVQQGSETWYEVYLSPNCISDTTLWLQQFTGWVSDGIGNGGPFLILGPAGIDPVSQSVFTFAPNPNQGYFSASFPIGTSEIIAINELGKRILTLDCRNETSKDIFLDQCPAGVYFLKFRFNGREINRKVILVK